MTSTRELVREWREYMSAALGPDYLAAMRERMDREEPKWQAMEMTVWDAEGNVLAHFVMLARGGFEGESLPDGPPPDW